MPHSERKLLIDLKTACQEIILYTSKMDFEEFKSDRVIQLAIERELEIIGEALNRLSKMNERRLELNIPEYTKIIGLRNIISHGYDIVDPEIIWDTIIHKVPDLMKKVDNYE